MVEAKGPSAATHFGDRISYLNPSELQKQNLNILQQE
jgi:hypothetical protein